MRKKLKKWPFFEENWDILKYVFLFAKNVGKIGVFCVIIGQEGSEARDRVERCKRCRTEIPFFIK